MTTTVLITTIRDDGTPFGAELAVGDVALAHVLRKFNPTDNRTVDMTKVLCAALIQQMINLRETVIDTTGPDVNVNATWRAVEKAIDLVEQAQMQAVKANFVQA